MSTADVLTSLVSDGRTELREGYADVGDVRLHYVEVASKKTKLVTQAKVWEIKDYVWSPDSKWIAYARSEEEMMPKVWLYSLEQDKHFAVTDGWHDSQHPEFSSDGKYLFFVSERDFNPLFNSAEFRFNY